MIFSLLQQSGTLGDSRLDTGLTTAMIVLVYIIPWVLTLGLIAISGWGLTQQWQKERAWFRWVLAVTATLLFWSVWNGLLTLFGTDQTGGVPAASVSMALAIVAFWAFLLGRALLGLFLKLPFRPFAVARTVLDEAIRMKIVVVFIVMLVLIVPFLPLIMAEETLLNYRVKQFLGWSIGATSLLLGLITIFLSCSTLASEMRDKQIFLSAVKPIPRGTYLLGKWMGIVLLNLLLVAISGLMIHGFTLGVLAQQQPLSWYDGDALRTQVLIARDSRMPETPKMNEEEATNWVNSLAKRSPQHEELINRLGGPDALIADLQTYGIVDVASIGQLSEVYARDPDLVETAGGPRAQLREMRKQNMANWWSVGPGQSRFYIMDDLASVREHMLSQAQAAGEDLQTSDRVGRLQLEFHLKGEGEEGQLIPLRWRINGIEYQQMQSPLGITQVLPIDARMIDEETGQLVIEIVNGGDRTISFPTDSGLRVFYPVGGFTPNFIRAMLVIWIKLSFLAALGLAVATFLGFPVASLLSLMVFFGSMISQYALESMGTLRRTTDYAFFQATLMQIGYFFARIVEPLGQLSPGHMLVDGIFISWTLVGSTMLWVGVFGTAIIGGMGWLIFSRRELARVQV